MAVPGAGVLGGGVTRKNVDGPDVVVGGVQAGGDDGVELANKKAALRPP